MLQQRRRDAGGAVEPSGVQLTWVGSDIRDQFLDVQYRAQNTATSNANTNASQLAQVQTAIDEPSSDGLQTVMSNFWSA